MSLWTSITIANGATFIKLKKTNLHNLSFEKFPFLSFPLFHALNVWLVVWTQIAKLYNVHSAYVRRVFIKKSKAYKDSI